LILIISSVLSIQFCNPSVKINSIIKQFVTATLGLISAHVFNNFIIFAIISVMDIVFTFVCQSVVGELTKYKIILQLLHKYVIEMVLGN